MRVPQSPHNFRRVEVPTANSDDDSAGSDTNSPLRQSPPPPSTTRPPRPTYRRGGKGDNKNKENNNFQDSIPQQNYGFHRSRERTRISAVQRLVERKLAQKEKEKEKERDRERDLWSARRGSSVGRNTVNNLRERSSSKNGNTFFRSSSASGLKNSSSRRTTEENEYLATLLLRTSSRSCSRDRTAAAAADAAKTYITISSGKPTRIREHSPSKKPTSTDVPMTVETKTYSSDEEDITEKDVHTPLPSEMVINKDVLKDCTPLKSTGLFREFSAPSNLCDAGNNKDNNAVDGDKKKRKASFTTERTFEVNGDSISSKDKSNNKGGRRLSIDFSYVFEQHTVPTSAFTSSGDSNKRNSTGSESSGGNPGSQAFFPFASSSHLSTSSDSVSSGSSTGSNVDKVTKRRISLEQRFQARVLPSSVGSSPGSSAASTPTEERPTATPAPMPRQRNRKSSVFRYSTESDCSTESNGSENNNSQSSFSNASSRLLFNLSSGYRHQQRDTISSAAKINNNGFHRRFSQDHSRPRPPRASSPMRKISLQNNSTINPESLADQKKEEGNQLYKTKNYREALSRYSEAIGLCPECPAFYGNRAACHMMLSQYAQALEDARTSVQLDASFVKGYVRVAKCCVSLGDVISAKQAIQAALNIDPNTNAFDQEKASLQFLERHQTDASNAYNNKDYRKALYCLDRALSIATASRTLKLARAECLAFLGRYAEAQEVANDLLRSDSMNADAIYVRGLCLYYEDNVDKAFTHFQQVLRLAPDHQKAKDIYKRARVLKQKKEEGNAAFKSGNWAAAYQLYSDALDIDPCNKFTNAKLYFNRATVAAKLKKLKESVDDCTMAIKLDENYLKAYLRRAKSYMELEQYEEAVRDYEQLHRMDRTSHEYRQLLQTAKLELKKSKRKDYYKILGITRNANVDDIKKAYRKRAMVHHPDRHSNASEEERREHERKFKEVGEAYGVLSDTKKKARYDSGHDLNDLEGHGGGFNGDIDPNQIFQAFFGGGPAGMHGSHSFTFGAGPGSGQMPGAFFQFDDFL